MPATTVNLNDFVTVRLTPLGHRILTDKLDALSIEVHKIPAPGDPWRVQFWTLANLLGAHFGNGFPMVLENMNVEWEKM